MYQEYEKVQDTLMYFGKNFVIKFNVSLAYKDKYGNRKFYLHEYKFESKNYKDVDSVVSVKRNIRSYLTIEEIGNFQNGIVINRSDLPLLRENIAVAARWLNDVKVFDINKGGKLSIISDQQIKQQIGMNNAIMMEPVIIPYPDGNSSKGIRFYISDMKNFTDVDYSNFMEFYELIRNFDMYTAACAVLAALPYTHEDAEVNRSDFENEASEYKRNYEKKPGFFDKGGT